jgi:hypothetical protein
MGTFSLETEQLLARPFVVRRLQPERKEGIHG